MIKYLLILVLLGSNCQARESTQQNLYPFCENNLYGFINSKGKIVIPPKFKVAKHFSEGLAAVRLNGTYGYIDETGTFVIPAQFDEAFNFNNGYAKVFIEGKPYIINNNGKILFEHNYKHISGISADGFAAVTTFSDKVGLINSTGRLILDTIFSGFIDISNGNIIVKGLNHKSYGNIDNKIINEIGIIDTKGNWKVPYGVYREINRFVNGYAEVTFMDKKNNADGIIDENGNFMCSISDNWFLDFSNPGFYQNIATISIVEKDKNNSKKYTSYNDEDYIGAINTQGELIFSNKDWIEISAYSSNRAFVKTRKGVWLMIDTKGNVVSPHKFEKVLIDSDRHHQFDVFQNGIAFVKTDKGWGAIDTSGNFVAAPYNFNNIDYNFVERVGDILFIVRDISVENDHYSYAYGFWNIRTNAYVPPKFHEIAKNDFDKELIPIVIDGLLGYILPNGEIVWMEQQQKEFLHQLDIDFMNRAYFYASSKRLTELNGFGGWGGSQNNSKSLEVSDRFQSDSIQVYIDTTQSAPWMKDFKGFKLWVINTTQDTMVLDAQDSRLYLHLQALDRHGVWKDIEYLPSSWCGNSYHSLFLAPNEFWEFAVPDYHGALKTKIRAVLTKVKNKTTHQNFTIYSNEIEGYINPGQFWNQHEYQPKGIMDPYNN